MRMIMDTLIVFSASYLYLIVVGLAGIVFLLVNNSTKRKIVKLAVCVFLLSFIAA